MHDMVDHLRGSGRNVTTDNFFTSFELGQELLQKNLTLVGTLRANRKEIPNVMLPSKERAPLSTVFGYTQNTLLASYVPKKTKPLFCCLHCMIRLIQVNANTKNQKSYYSTIPPSLVLTQLIKWQDTIQSNVLPEDGH